MSADWKSQLNAFLGSPEQARPSQKGDDLAAFIDEVVLPAFGELDQELRKHGRDVTLRHTESSAALIVHRNGEEELSYRIQGRMFPHGVLPFAQIRCRERKGLKYVTVETMVRPGPQTYRICDITSEEIIASFLDNYTRRVHAE